MEIWGPLPPHLGWVLGSGPQGSPVLLLLVSLQFRPCFLFKQEVKSCLQELLLMESLPLGGGACGEGRGVVAVIEEG